MGLNLVVPFACFVDCQTRGFVCLGGTEWLVGLVVRFSVALTGAGAWSPSAGGFESRAVRLGRLLFAYRLVCRIVFVSFATLFARGPRTTFVHLTPGTVTRARRKAELVGVVRAPEVAM